MLAYLNLAMGIKALLTQY